MVYYYKAPNYKVIILDKSVIMPDIQHLYADNCLDQDGIIHYKSFSVM